MKTLLICLCCVSICGGTPAPVAPPVAMPAPPTTADHDPAHPAETRENLLEIIYHVFLWYHDKSFLDPRNEAEEMVIYFRAIDRPLDDGDRSRFAEIYLSAIGLLVELKRSDYPLAEIGLAVQDDLYKIRRVDYVARLPEALRDHRQTTVSRDELNAWFADRDHQASPLSGALQAHIRDALLQHQVATMEPDASAQIFHLSPLSPVSNDIWVLHENTNELLQFSADMDLNDLEVWARMHLRLRVHPLDPNLIFDSPLAREIGGQLAKDFIGRALFNCVVLGNRLEVSPADVEAFRTRANGRTP